MCVWGAVDKSQVQPACGWPLGEWSVYGARTTSLFLGPVPWVRLEASMDPDAGLGLVPCVYGVLWTSPRCNQPVAGHWESGPCMVRVRPRSFWDQCHGSGWRLQWTLMLAWVLSHVCMGCCGQVPGATSLWLATGRVVRVWCAYDLALFGTSA